jgi:hypothetical protein
MKRKGYSLVHCADWGRFFRNEPPFGAGWMRAKRTEEEAEGGDEGGEEGGGKLGEGGEMIIIKEDGDGEGEKGESKL